MSCTSLPQRDFDRTLLYLRVRELARKLGQEWKLECLRTTSPLERVQRHFRQKARQIVLPHSWTGVEVAVLLVISHRQLIDARSPDGWTDQLEEALLAA